MAVFLGNDREGGRVMVQVGDRVRIRSRQAIQELVNNGAYLFGLSLKTLLRYAGNEYVVMDCHSFVGGLELVVTIDFGHMILHIPSIFIEEIPHDVIQVGDWVKIKGWKKLPKGSDGMPRNFPIFMKPLCGLIAQVSRINPCRQGIELILDGNPVLLARKGWYHIYDYMVDKVEGI